MLVRSAWLLVYLLGVSALVPTVALDPLTCPRACAAQRARGRGRSSCERDCEQMTALAHASGCETETATFFECVASPSVDPPCRDEQRAWSRCVVAWCTDRASDPLCPTIEDAFRAR
jgi:hypothetical protein